MRIQSNQLLAALTKNIAPLYLVAGDESFLVQEASDTIRKHAITKGYHTREVFYVEAGFNWEVFLSSVNNASLFSNLGIIELHLKSKLTDKASKILQNYAKNSMRDKTLIIISTKLDATQQKTSWFKEIDTHGVVLLIWPIEPTEMPLWLTNRLKQAGLKTNPAGVQLLTAYVSGNLAAASQEIEKLKLLYGSGNLTTEQISVAITDNARFNIFNLVDAAMNKKVATVNRILDKLKTEDGEPTLILWSIGYELRSLINLSFSLKSGGNLEQAMRQNNIWQRRQPLIKKLLLEYDLKQLENLLKAACSIDLMIKGADNQHLLWHELKKLYLKFADNKITSPLPSLT